MNKRLLLAALLACALAVSACVQATPTPDLVATQVVVIRAAEATLTASAPTVTPTGTETFTPTSTATDTPEPPTSTPTPMPPTDTPTPRPPTHTPTPKPPTSTPRPTSAPTTPPVGVRNNPVPLGQAVKFERKPGSAVLLVRVAEVVRGQRAIEMMQAANMFNGVPADPALEWILVRMEGDYVSGPQDNPHHVDELQFSVFALNREIEQPLGGIPPEPTFEGNYYPGANLNGWMAFFVARAEPNPLLRWGNAWILPDRYMWFALGETAGRQPAQPPAAAPSNWTLVADSVTDYLGPAGGDRKWWYLWSEGMYNFDWQDMRGPDGGCYETPNDWKAAICADRAVADARGDLALQWKARAAGKYLLEWDTNTQSGSGQILVYRHLDEARTQGPGPTLGNSAVFDNVGEWEMFFFVIRASSERWETSLHVRAYLWQE